MNKTDSPAICTICGQRNKKFETILGALICKSCIESLSVARLRPLQRFGEIECETGSNFFKPFWLKTHGELTNLSENEIEAIFTKKKIGYSVEDKSFLNIQSGDPGFDKRVSIHTRTSESTSQFLQAPEVKEVIAFITSNGGRIEIDGSKLDIMMSGHIGMSTSTGFPIMHKGKWGSGILFSHLASFYET